MFATTRRMVKPSLVDKKTRRRTMKKSESIQAQREGDAHVDLYRTGLHSLNEWTSS